MPALAANPSEKHWKCPAQPACLLTAPPEDNLLDRPESALPAPVTWPGRAETARPLQTRVDEEKVDDETNTPTTTVSCLPTRRGQSPNVDE